PTSVPARSCACPSPWPAVYDLARQWRSHFTNFHHGLLGLGVVPAASAQSQITWGLHISLVPAWFDPADVAPPSTALVVMSALHDALVKPMPGQPLAPSLAESWQTSKDGLVYEFTLRNGVLFHNGDRVTAEDVKFSFERYRGPASNVLKDKVAAVEVVD